MNPPSRGMTDGQIGLLPIIVWIGALLPMGSSTAVAVVSLVPVALGWRMRRPVVLLVAAGVAASLLAGGAWAGVEPAGSGHFEGHALLMTDPEAVPGGVRVKAQIDGRRYDLRAWGSPAGWLRNRLMGETVELEANLRPLGDAPDWLLAQGLSGRGTVTSVASFDVGAPHTRLANSIRRTIEAGAESLSRDHQALFAGLVYGDDRDQTPLTADNFEAAGLTHLLAVSGQNVAFVLAIAGPVLRRLGYRRRFVFVVGVLLLFATVTRFEPSVVRASVMTGVAAVGSLVGSELSSRRVLSLAVGLLVLVDPLIVHSVAFQLSVAASAGILFWSGRVARAVPGPRMFAESLAVTATAQLAVAPLLVWRFDGLPVASLPANLLAGPAAGPVMMWGLTGGMVAGLGPGWLAALVHQPTRVALVWIDGVAAAAPELPLGRLGAAHIVLLFVFGVGWLGQRRGVGRAGAAAALIVVLLHPAVVIATTPAHTRAIDTDSVIWRDETVTVVELDAASRPQQVLSILRAANVGDIDLVIVHQGSRQNASMIKWMRSHHDIASVWAPQQSLGVGEVIPADGSQLTVDGVQLTINHRNNKLDVTAIIAPEPEP